MKEVDIYPVFMRFYVQVVLKCHSRQLLVARDLSHGESVSVRLILDHKVQQSATCCK